MDIDSGKATVELGSDGTIHLVWKPQAGIETEDVRGHYLQRFPNTAGFHRRTQACPQVRSNRRLGRSASAKTT